MDGLGIECSPRALPIVEEIKHLDNRGVHNFSWAILDCYFQLKKLAQQRAVRFIGPGVLELSRLPGTNRIKVFVYSARSAEFIVPQQDRLSELQKTAVIYSIDQLPLPKESKFKELCYDLDEVFNPANYASSKKRHQRITYPFTWLDREGFELHDIVEMVPDIQRLHDVWVEKKLDDPATFKMMFPGKRYLNCVTRALEEPQAYRIFGVYRHEELVAVRVVGIADVHAYDMAFFGATWDLPSQSMNYINICILKALHTSGIKHFNCGCFLNKRLHQFKAHYPHYEKISYAYSKL